MRPFSSSGDDGRVSGRKVVAFAGWLLGLLFVAVLAVFNRIELARLSESSPVETQDARLQALTARVAELVQESETYRKRAEAVSLERYDTEQQALEQRLTAIERVWNARSDEDLS
jgi:hypothetical protein